MAARQLGTIEARWVWGTPPRWPGHTQEGSNVSARTIINPAQSAMAMEGKPDGDMVLGRYPGVALSISELCHALKIKLAQARDSRYAYTPTRRLLFGD